MTATAVPAATTVARSIRAVWDRHGRLTGELLVAEAARKSHPLHDRFEWDDRIAGHRYRVAQAERLIRSVEVLLEDPAESRAVNVREWIAVDRDGSGYRPTLDVFADAGASAAVLEAARREFAMFRHRYFRFAEVREMVADELGAAQ